MPKPRTEEELWEALQRLDDPLDANVPVATIDAELAAAGLDPKTLAAEGAQAAKEFAEEKRLAWQRAALRKASTFAKCDECGGTGLVQVYDPLVDYDPAEDQEFWKDP